MRQTLIVFGLTIAFLAVMDAVVATTLNWAERSGRLGGLVQYFEYGRSVPGKLEKWEHNPEARGNLYDVAWRADQLSDVDQVNTLSEPQGAPVIRSYGMSFVNNILRKAVEQSPEIMWDAHAGPGAPPNYTYAYFEDDGANRNAGDIVVLGILSSSIPAMTAHSNSTWVFEQPAPFTYPIYEPSNGQLNRVDPIVETAASHRALASDPAKKRMWYDQLSENDPFFDKRVYGFPQLDASPFIRLVRRSWATSHIATTEAEILRGGGYPFAEALRLMISEFAATARADEQFPVVMLIQSNDPRDVDLLKLAQPTLAQYDIAYLATAELHNPQDPSGFEPDGHFKSDIDQIFSNRFLELIAPIYR